VKPCQNLTEAKNSFTFLLYTNLLEIIYADVVTLFFCLKGGRGVRARVMAVLDKQSKNCR